ncbi:MAG TPA: serine hydrolase [Pyrinomonadaceae bacterium]|nr:serine hydrolase [Pyrinomonadaceae bacterium]
MIYQLSLRFRALVVCALIILSLQAAAVAQQAGSTKAAKIDEFMTLANKYRLFNGSVLVADQGKVIYKKGFGLANMEWEIPNTPDTKFRLASITKQFTATAVLQLAAQGKIRLDGKLSEYLPEYRKDIGDKVTIHQLLNHTSGIPSYTGMPGFFQEVSRTPFKVDDFVKKYASNDLEFEPGSKFSYNNSGYFLLGAIIEKVTGKPYEQVLKENIFEPLGMKNSGYDRFDTLLKKRATGYQKTPDGYVNAPYLDMSIPYSAGSLYSTVEDLYLWDQALYSDSLLNAQFKELMFKPNLENYAYGWTIRKAGFDDKIPVIQHNGGINGFSTTIIRFPAEKGLIVMLDNTATGGNIDRLSSELSKILYDRAYNMPKLPVVELLAKTIAEKGVAAGIAQYQELKTKQSNVYDFSEGELNRLGYQLLQGRKHDEAIQIFKLNVEAYPQAFNTYDSLGEAYMAAGNKDLAIANYKKSLELNPKNDNGAAMLKRLESKAEPVDPKTYDSYVGEYEVSPTFIVKMFKEGDKLMTQATNQPALELFPDGADKFMLRGVNAKVTFVKDAAGTVTGLVINKNGRDINAKKIK